MQRLIVKKFGPLKNIDIELKDINLIIGKNGEGKSILGKLITILNGFYSEEEFIQRLKDYELYQYLTENTEIIFSINNKSFYSIKNNNLKISEPLLRLLTLLNELYQINLDKSDELNTFSNFKNGESMISFIKKAKKVNNIEIKQIKDSIKTAYIPAERNLISLFSQHIATLILSGLPLPKYLLEFIREFEQARGEIKELSFIDFKYKLENNIDKVFYDEKNFLPLNKSSSGLQAIIPLVLIIRYFYKRVYRFVIEEPELNLFPNAQNDLVRYIISNISQKSSVLDETSENSVFFTPSITILTHSPYILSSFNNLLFADKTAQQNSKTKEMINKIIEEKYWVDSNHFTAYSLKNGVATSILDKNGLINENNIDLVSEKLAEEFDQLIDIYREYKND